jgi:hypothetical protein
MSYSLAVSLILLSLQSIFIQASHYSFGAMNDLNNKKNPFQCGEYEKYLYTPSNLSIYFVNFVR